MANVSVVGLSSVAIADRIDGEHYLPEYMENERALSNIKTEPLPRHFYVSDGNHLSVSRHFSTTEGRPYYRGQDITDFFIEDVVPIRIPESIFLAPMMRRSHFQAGDVLLSIVGTIGSLSLVPDSIGPATGSCKIAILRSKGRYSAPFLAAFLLSQYGQLQISRHTRGAVQMGLILKDISKIRIPLVSDDMKEACGSLIEEAIRANSKSRASYSAAQRLLESELRLDKLGFKKPMGYKTRFTSISLSQAFSAGRVDAQCFSPSAMLYEKWLKERGNCERLAYLLSSSVKGRQQEEAANGTDNYCSIKHINGRELVDGSKCFPDAGTQFADKDDLLLAITGATIGKIGIVKRYNRLAFSGDLLRLRPSAEISPHYLLLALDHSLGQVQFNRWITGSTNGHLSPRDVGRVLIPRLKSHIEFQIGELVEKSLAMRLESERMLEQAKTRVEQLIEEAVNR